MSEQFRVLPGVDKLLLDERVRDVRAPEEVKHQSARGAVAALRAQIAAGLSPDAEEALRLAADETVRRAAAAVKPSYRRVINATGIVLHTNLGRAVLSDGARRAVMEVLAGYSNLELDLEGGKRGDRYGRIPDLLCALTGAPSALVVNNNAAGLALAMNTLAAGREAIVSKGELVEIGDGFRIPELLRRSGLTLCEVGTTNRTYLADYEQAITAQTALLLKIHTSNYTIQGFSHSVSTAELAELGAKHSLPVVSDLGSGLLLADAGNGAEPLPASELRDGADLVLFSGDKLLGGPQAGLLAGRADLVAAIRKNPLLRAVRADKMTLAALEATLLAYLDPASAPQIIPVLRMLSASPETLRERAEGFCARLQALSGLDACTENCLSPVGGGSMPGELRAGTLVLLSHELLSAGELAALLRGGEPAILAFQKKDRVALDVRTMTEDEVEMTVRRLADEIGGTFCD